MQTTVEHPLVGRRDGAAESVVRTLPIKVTPLPGEALDSYLEALAARLQTSCGELWSSIGMDSATTSGIRMDPSSVLTAVPEQLVRASLATGLSVSDLRSMTLSDLMSAQSPLQTIAFRRLFLLGSRFCPSCLTARGGRWYLWWRLRWAFACPVHHCLLADTCPDCGGHQRLRFSPWHLVPEPGRCNRLLPWRRRCGADLTYATPQLLSADHPAVVAQEQILDRVAGKWATSGIYGRTATPLQTFLHDLTALAHRLLPYGPSAELRARLAAELRQCLLDCEPDKSAELLPPSWILHNATRAPMVAVAACLAVPIVMSATTAQAADRRRGLPALSRRQALTSFGVQDNWVGEVIDVLLIAPPSRHRPIRGPTDQLRYRRATARPSLPRLDNASPQAIPALMWPHWAMAMYPDTRRLERIQAALSVAVLVVGSSMPTRSACAALGSITDPRVVSRVLQNLHHQPHWETTASMLISLADQLAATPGPIDYQRRRELPLSKLLPGGEWRNVCQASGVQVGQTLKIHLHRYWLYQRLTGSPPRHSTGAALDKRTAAALAELPRSLTPKLVEALDRVGRRFLDSQGLAHEPLRWQPTDLACAMASAAPQPFWNIDIEALHRMVRADNLALGVAASKLGTSIDIVRWTLNEHPAAAALIRGRCVTKHSRTSTAPR